MFSTYFAKSLRNGKVYVGFTEKEPFDRVSEHNKGVNKWSKRNKPFKLIYFEKYYCKSDGRLRERYYKQAWPKRPWFSKEKFVHCFASATR